MAKKKAPKRTKLFRKISATPGAAAALSKPGRPRLKVKLTGSKGKSRTAKLTAPIDLFVGLVKGERKAQLKFPKSRAKFN